MTGAAAWRVRRVLWQRRPLGKNGIIAVLGFTQCLSWGSSYYLLAVLAKPIEADTGWPLSWIVGGLSLGLLIAGFASPVMGRAVERFGGRPILFLIHDRHAIFSRELDQRVRHLGLRVLKTPVRSPQANALCERLLGTLRRECLGFVIPLTEHHLRRLLYEWVVHYNMGRPHMALGPGIPQPPLHVPAPRHVYRHRLPAHLRVAARPILGGLHHEYRLEEQVA